MHCADVIITCLGSAGFELPAMAGIPSITAGDNFYTGLGFVREPRTEKEYLSLLATLHAITRLDPAQQRIARAAYTYIYEFSRVNISACPPLSLVQEKENNNNLAYLDAVSARYHSDIQKINEEIKRYVQAVAFPGFYRLEGFYE